MTRCNCGPRLLGRDEQNWWLLDASGLSSEDDDEVIDPARVCLLIDSVYRDALSRNECC